MNTHFNEINKKGVLSLLIALFNRQFSFSLFLWHPLESPLESLATVPALPLADVVLSSPLSALLLFRVSSMSSTSPLFVTGEILYQIKVKF